MFMANIKTTNGIQGKRSWIGALTSLCIEFLQVQLSKWEKYWRWLWRASVKFRWRVPSGKSCASLWNCSPSHAGQLCMPTRGSQHFQMISGAGNPVQPHVNVASFFSSTCSSNGYATGIDDQDDSCADAAQQTRVSFEINDSRVCKVNISTNGKH